MEAHEPPNSTGACWRSVGTQRLRNSSTRRARDRRVAYRPAVSCDTTDEISEQDLAAFEFIISTDDEPPPLDTVSTGVERVDRVDVYLDFDLEDEERAPGPLVCPSDSP